MLCCALLCCAVQACKTLAELLASNPGLSKATRLLRSTPQLWEQLKNRNATLTVFAASNPGFERGYNSSGGRASALLAACLQPVEPCLQHMSNV